MPGSRPGNRSIIRWRGKSGLHRAGCQVTPGGREPTESATENIPPVRLERFGPVRVKWCGKSAPRRWQHSVARQTPPGARPNRKAMPWPAGLSGRSHEAAGDGGPR